MGSSPISSIFIQNIQAQAELLRGIGCDYIQGYYFYRPLPLKEAERVLDEMEGAGGNPGR